jgi:hypothetical protein
VEWEEYHVSNEAIKPMPEWMHGVLKDHEEEKIEPGESLDNTLLSLSQSDAWKYLKEYINTKRSTLASELRKKADSSSSLDEIGFRFMALDLVNRFADQIISRVENVAKIKGLENESTTE